MKALLQLAIIAGLCCMAPSCGRASRFVLFQATAYCEHGITRSGVPAHPGVVAADPRVLTLGTRIRVANAGVYSGVYVVRDTGSMVVGRHIDLFIPRRAAAIEFGRKRVLVAVLSRPPHG